MTWHDFTWLDPMWQCTCDKTVISQHPGSHFLIISSVLCKDGNNSYEQLVHWGEFGSKCLDALRQHKSDDESGEDTISAAIWEVCMCRATLSVWKKVCLFRGIWRIFLGAVDRYPECWPVPWLLLLLNDHHESVRKQSAELGVLYLTMFDHKKDLVMKWFWPVFVIELSDVDMRLSQSMCLVVGMISGSLVSWESSLFRWMCNLLHLLILKFFLGLNRILITHFRCKTTHRKWW